MTHSPLCRWHGSTEFETVVGCDECDLIAKVREDALAAAVQRVEALICIDCLKHLMADDGWATCFYCVGVWETLAAIKGGQL
jgi:hypothetical protein